MGGEESPEQQYSLRWNDFHASILSSFRHLRDEEDFVDVTLACEGCSFTAHKVVLSACSPYFRKLLKANPCQHPIVILRDVQQKDMESLLRFMYNGEVHIGQEQLGDFLKTAQMLQVRGLADVPTGAGHHRTIPISATPTSTEQKLSPISSSVQWGPADDSERDGGSSPPPAKRSRSAEHPGRNFSPDRPRSPRMKRENDRDSTELRESLLGQALEGGPTIHVNSTNQKGQSDSSLQAQSTGEESNSSDTALSDRGGTVTPKTEPSDYPMMEDHPLLQANGGGGAANLMDQARQHNFPGALLGLQGLPGLLPGPSGMHNSSPDNFGVKEEPQDSEESTSNTEFYSYRDFLPLEHVSDISGPERVWRCQECGKTYSSNNNLKQHMINIHSPVITNYPCDICGRGFKSRQYLATHKVRCHNIRRTEFVRNKSYKRMGNF